MFIISILKNAFSSFVDVYKKHEEIIKITNTYKEAVNSLTLAASVYIVNLKYTLKENSDYHMLLEKRSLFSTSYIRFDIEKIDRDGKKYVVKMTY